MDKYLILIKKLETELTNLELEINDIEDKIKEKKLRISSLESIISITKNKINNNQIKINDKKNVKQYFKMKKFYYLKIFAILFLILSSSLLLTNFLPGVGVGIINKIFISLGTSAFIVGGAYFLTTKDDLEYYNSIDVKKMHDKYLSLLETITEKNTEKANIEMDIEVLEEKRSKLQENIALKKETLNNISKVRNEIIESILSKLVEQEIKNSTVLPETSRQKILNK